MDRLINFDSYYLVYPTHTLNNWGLVDRLDRFLSLREAMGDLNPFLLGMCRWALETSCVVLLHHAGLEDLARQYFIFFSAAVLLFFKFIPFLCLRASP